MPQAGEYKVERRRLMERFWGHAYRWRVWIGAAILAAAAWVLRPVLLALATQIFWADLLMGVMELIPSIGPLLAGIPAVLLGLTGGWNRALWTLAVLVGVQQLEGGILSPRMLSGATKLSPLTVLLSISAGGLLGGTLGMLLALPVVVSLRGALRAFRSEVS